MTHTHTTLRLLAVTAAVCAASGAHATISVNNSAASGPFLAGSNDTFSDLTINTFLQSLSVTRSAGPFRYVAGSTFSDPAQSDLFVAPIAGNVALSIAWFADSLSFSILSPAIYAFGGNFFASNPLGEAVGATSITVTLTDVAGTSLTQTRDATVTTFTGFVSDVPLRFATVRLTSGTNVERYITADNVNLSAVPEPSTWMMMLAGAAVALRIAKRRSP